MPKKNVDTTFEEGSGLPLPKKPSSHPPLTSLQSSQIHRTVDEVDYLDPSSQNSGLGIRWKPC